MLEPDFADDLASDPRELMQDALADFYRLDVTQKGGGGAADAAELWAAVWRAAGIVGVDPHGLTFGELLAMADGRMRHQWDMQSALMALTHNIHAKGSKPPGHFNPFSRASGRTDVLTADIADLAEIVGAKPWRDR